MSDFPEFDAQYRTVLIKDKEDRFEQLAAEANFNVYHSDIWRGTGRKFAELIVRECVEQGKLIQSQTIVNGSEEYVAGREMGIEVFMNQIKQHFGVE